MAGEDPDEVEEVPNQQLDELLEKYDAWDFLPFAGRIIWLASVREALGYIPENFNLDYEEVRGLVILKEEQGRKLAYDNWQASQEAKTARSGVPSIPHIPHVPNVSTYGRRR